MPGAVSAGLVHLVDDDMNVRATLARLLRSGGYTVREYRSGEDLLKVAGSLNSGCILLDISMPGMDGFAVHRALSEALVELPTIMMTGSGDLAVLALKAGAADFMQKPFDRSELLSVLAQLSTEVSDG